MLWFFQVCDRLYRRLDRSQYIIIFRATKQCCHILCAQHLFYGVEVRFLKCLQNVLLNLFECIGRPDIDPLDYHLVALDCEMVECEGETGSDQRVQRLARCTVVDAKGKTIYDELCKPEKIVDYCTKWVLSCLQGAYLCSFSFLPVQFYAVRKQRSTHKSCILWCLFVITGRKIGGYALNTKCTSGSSALWQTCSIHWRQRM